MVRQSTSPTVRTTYAPKLRSRRSYLSRFKQQEWSDPYPDIPGTKPTKMVYAELVRRGIRFEYDYFMGDAPFTRNIESIFVDFYLPETKKVILVESYYFYKYAGQVDRKALLYAILVFWGYKVVWWWDIDIEVKLWELFEDEPDLYMRGTRLPIEHKEYEHAQYVTDRLRSSVPVRPMKPAVPKYRR